MAEVDNVSSSPRIGAVLYAQSLDTLAEFYAAVARCSVEHVADDHVVLETGGFELTIVAIPSDIADTIVVAQPPQRREDTPVKLAFVVDDLARARVAAADLGGMVDDPSAEWTFRETTHCDGHDPEGNVFQLRQAAPVG